MPYLYRFFPQNSPIMSGSFAERDPQHKASYTSSPHYTRHIMSRDSVFAGDLPQQSPIIRGSFAENDLQLIMKRDSVTSTTRLLHMIGICVCMYIHLYICIYVCMCVYQAIWQERKSTSTPTISLLLNVRAASSPVTRRRDVNLYMYTCAYAYIYLRIHI